MPSNEEKYVLKNMNFYASNIHLSSLEDWELAGSGIGVDVCDLPRVEKRFRLFPTVKFLAFLVLVVVGSSSSVPVVSAAVTKVVWKVDVALDDVPVVPLVLDDVVSPGFLVGILSLGLEVVESSSAVVAASVVEVDTLVETDVLTKGVVSEGDPVSSTIEPLSSSPSSSLSPISSEIWRHNQ